jgi:hypothetical protein
MDGESNEVTRRVLFEEYLGLGNFGLVDVG